MCFSTQLSSYLSVLWVLESFLLKKKKKSFFLTGDLPGFGDSWSDKLECGVLSRCGNLWGLSENAEKFMRDHP